MNWLDHVVDFEQPISEKNPETPEQRGIKNSKASKSGENNTLGLSLTRSNIVRNGHKSYHVQKWHEQ